MGSSRKRQQTIAKRNRERAVEEKRTLKRLKKQQAKADRAAGIEPGLGPEQRIDGDTEAPERMIGVDAEGPERTIDGEAEGPKQEPPVELGNTG